MFFPQKMHGYTLGKTCRFNIICEERIQNLTRLLWGNINICVCLPTSRWQCVAVLGLCVITLLPVVTPPHFLLEPLPHFL